MYIVITPNGKPIYPLINNLLVYLTDNNISFLATAIFAVFCLYLLLATIKGNVKFGLRILFLFSIHPMKYYKNYNYLEKTKLT